MCPRVSCGTVSGAPHPSTFFHQSLLHRSHSPVACLPIFLSQALHGKVPATACIICLRRCHGMFMLLSHFPSSSLLSLSLMRKSATHVLVCGCLVSSSFSCWLLRSVGVFSARHTDCHFFGPVSSPAFATLTKALSGSLPFSLGAWKPAWHHLSSPTLVSR